jgi:hypothetical protein
VTTYKEPDRRFSDIYIQEVITTSGFVLLIYLEVIPLNLPSRPACAERNGLIEK